VKQNERVALCWDHFSVHTTAAVEHAVEAIGCVPHMVPRHCTGDVQVMDMSLNAIMKTLMRREFLNWMNDPSGHTFTPKGNMRKPDINLIQQWVKRSWDAITPEAIKKCFQRAGILDLAPGLRPSDVSYYLIVRACTLSCSSFFCM